MHIMHFKYTDFLERIVGGRHIIGQTLEGRLPRFYQSSGGEMPRNG